MFDHKKIREVLLKSPGTITPGYGVGAEWKADSKWRLVGVYHLLPSENVGKNNVYIDGVDKSGKRVPLLFAGWDWEGRQENQKADPVRMDKPDNEPAGNIALHAGQKIKVFIKGLSSADNDPSDSAYNIHTGHPDEPGGNFRYHHSFYVLFQEAGALPPPPPVDPPPSDQAHLTLVEVKRLIDSYFAELK